MSSYRLVKSFNSNSFSGQIYLAGGPISFSSSSSATLDPYRPLSSSRSTSVDSASPPSTLGQVDKSDRVQSLKRLKIGESLIQLQVDPFIFTRV